MFGFLYVTIYTGYGFGATYGQEDLSYRRVGTLTRGRVCRHCSR